MAERAHHPKVKAALELIQQAQNLLYNATAELSGVDGYFEQCRRVSNLADEVKRTWYAVAGDPDMLTD